MLPLEEKVDPRHTALVVVDIQNDYAHGDGSFGKRGSDLSMAQAMVPKLVDFIAKARANGVTIIFVRTAHGEWTDSPVRQDRMKGMGLNVLPVCLEGSWGAEFYKVEPEPGDKIVVKHRYSGFYGTDLDVVLKARGIKTLLMTGLVTNVCVETTARDGFMRDYYIVLVEDGCAASTVEEHQAALVNISRYFGVVATTDEVAKAWSR